jgi:integral membrane protein
MALVEASSLIALFLIAMPLKYMADMPIAVKIVGPIHGALFVWTLGMLIFVLSRRELAPSKGLLFFFAMLIPFAGIWSHRMIDRRIAEYTRTNTVSQPS